MNEIAKVYLLLLACAIVVFYGLFKVIQIKRQLGRVKFKIVTTYQILTILYFSLFWIMFSYVWIDTAEYREIPYNLQVALTVAVLGVYIYSMYMGYMNGEVRENGVIIDSTAFSWDEMRHFKLTCEDTIMITTNTKSLFSKNDKKIKLRVDKNRVDKLVGFLSQYVEER